MHPLASALLNLLSSVPDSTVAVVHPDDYIHHLRDSLGESLIPASSQATITSGCVGHISRETGSKVALYLRRSVPRGEARIGTVALLKELRR